MKAPSDRRVLPSLVLLFMLGLGCAPPGQYAGPPPGGYQQYQQPYNPYGYEAIEANRKARIEEAKRDQRLIERMEERERFRRGQ